MSTQLSLFGSSDTDRASLPKSSSDAKRQAIQRFLNGGKSEPLACVNTYSPGRRSTQYYRLSFNWYGKKNHIHIRGGAVGSELADYRAGKVQALIDRGAELQEIIAMVKTFNS